MAFAIIYFFFVNFKYIITFGFKSKEQDKTSGFLNKNMTGLIIYSTLFWIIYFFYAEIDSTNRFFSHNPVYYWYMSTVIAGKKFTNKIGGIILLSFFFLYYVLGILLFSNFMDWT